MTDAPAANAPVTGALAADAVQCERRAWLREVTAIAALSAPLALTNLAQIAMIATDVMMMGWIGPKTLAAGALGSNLYFIALVAGIGLLNASAPLMAAALGRDASDSGSLQRTVQTGLWSALALAVPCWLALWQSEAILRAIGEDPELSHLAGIYARALQWALLPFWGFLVLRSYVSVLQRPGWALAVALSGVAVNAAGNWCLLLGRCGIASLGIAGSGLATTLAALLMFLVLAMAASFDPHLARHRVLARFAWPDRPQLARLWRLGLPLAAMLLFEVTIFNAAVFLTGLIGMVALAAHQIAIQIASMTFMVPLGIGQAATVRVGLAYGAGDIRGVQRAGWSAFWLSAVFMSAMALLMIAAPRWLIAAFLDTGAAGNREVVRLATTLLWLAALFQVADGAQAVGGAMLRGLHDARVPMIYALVGYWGIGLPAGCLLAFTAGLGAPGIWIGLALGTGVVAALMTWRWCRRDALGLLRPTDLRPRQAGPTLAPS